MRKAGTWQHYYGCLWQVLKRRDSPKTICHGFENSRDLVVRRPRFSKPLCWCHNERDSVSNHQPHDCLLKRLFRRRSKEHQSSASLVFVRGIHRWPVNSPHKGPVTRKMLPFDDVIMQRNRFRSGTRFPSDGLKVEMVSILMLHYLAQIDISYTVVALITPKAVYML